MNISLNWINAYLDRPADSADELGRTLTNVGFGCEGMEPLENGDMRFDFEITSNRGDCVSVLGLAREYAAATGRTVNIPEPMPATSNEAAASATQIKNDDHELCPYYSARIIQGVKVGPSPDWLRERVESVGLRSVNNVVDITNFVLYEFGQPLHAFDLDTLHEKRIVIRRAQKGEKMTAIDGSKLDLDDSMLVIADADRPVAVAGVMGGLDTEVGGSTTNILLEAAVFHPASVRTTSRRLKLLSDSSYRFERGIHPATVARAADRAAQLLVELTGGTLLKGALIEATPISDLIEVRMRPARCRKIAGVDIPTSAMIDILTILDMSPILSGEGENERISCTIPAPRLDLTREIDLIEEVVRLYGFDHIETRDRIEIDVAPVQPAIANRQRVDETLAACGFFEIITFSFVSEKDAKAFLPPDLELLSVQDDRRKAEPVLQPSLFPGLLRCRKRNQDTGHENVRLYEQAACFCLKNGETLERSNLGLLLDAPDPQAGLRAMRAAVDATVREVLGRDAILTVRPVDLAWFEPNGAAALFIGDEVLGTMGVLRGSVQDQFELRTPVVLAELGIASLYDTEAPTPQLGEMTLHPAIQRDLSILVDEPIAWSKIEDVVAEADPNWLDRLEFVGVYRGKPIDQGQKSVSLRLTFRASDRTLRHEEIDPIVDHLVDRLGRDTGAKLRV